MDQRFADPRCALTPDEQPAGHICPLFWQHAEDPEVLCQEMQAMRSAGIRQCILESRPHPDWLGPGWWASLDSILEEAERLGMRVWVFDDATYPTGRAGNLMRDRHPDLLKLYLACRVIEAHGPLPGATFLAGAWAGKDEKVAAVVAGRRMDARGDSLDPESLRDLSDRIRDGTVRWDVPDGLWRVFVLVRTRDGGEEWTRDYFNPLLAEAGRAFIAEVYEPHFQRYAARFGTTFAGFFYDEPRFGNKPTYDARLGSTDMVIPWSDDLLSELGGRWHGGFTGALPALWHDAGDLSSRARALYMDVVSARFGRNFTTAVGDWCRAHGVRLIGHVVEDNSAHARLGHGAGHYFRSQRGQDMSGVDIVYQVWPGFPTGTIATPFGPWDLDFFRWGLAKLASSDAHADPRKAGRAMCEIFGAYGWQLGLRDMKWLTDFACVRGINFLVPHAFSPKFPDPDCPPHYYARGNNPQWHLFGTWSAYAERLCHLLSGGQHEADAAVLYHAEAEWAGPCEHFEASVATLAKRQIDCDVVSIDTLLDPALTRFGKAGLTVNRESFSVLVVPRARQWPDRFTRFAEELRRAGVKIVTDGAELGDIGSVRVTPDQPHLRTMRYSRPGMRLVFCFNEDIRASVDCGLTLEDPRDPVGYDALSDTILPVESTRKGSRITARIRLEPYESLFLVYPDRKMGATGSIAPRLKEIRAVTGPWKVSLPGLSGPGDISAAPGQEHFAGTAVYDTNVELPAGEAWLDLGQVGESSEVWLDEVFLGARICPPHRFALPQGRGGRRAVRIAITTTLARRLGNNAFDRAMAQEPIGLLGPVRILARSS